MIRAGGCGLQPIALAGVTGFRGVLMKNPRLP